MEENKVATDSSAPNSPGLTRLSGEQAEERTEREALRKLLGDGGGEVILEADTVLELLSECSRLASHVHELESDVRRWKDASDANRDEAMKQQDFKLEQKQIASRLASRVEELEKGLREIYIVLDGPLSASDKVYCLKLLKRVLAGAHAEEKNVE